MVGEDVEFNPNVFCLHHADLASHKTAGSATTGIGIICVLVCLDGATMLVVSARLAAECVSDLRRRLDGKFERASVVREPLRRLQCQLALSKGHDKNRP